MWYILQNTGALLQLYCQIKNSTRVIRWKYFIPSPIEIPKNRPESRMKTLKNYKKRDNKLCVHISRNKSFNHMFEKIFIIQPSLQNFALVELSKKITYFQIPVYPNLTIHSSFESMHFQTFENDGQKFLSSPIALYWGINDATIVFSREKFKLSKKCIGFYKLFPFFQLSALSEIILIVIG